MYLASTMSLKVEKVSLEDLKEWTLNYKWNWDMDTHQFEKADSVYCADEDTILRWEINFIRHNLTNYDEEIKKLYGMVGKDDAYSQYREELMKKIYEVYPELE